MVPCNFLLQALFLGPVKDFFEERNLSLVVLVVAANVVGSVVLFVLLPLVAANRGRTEIVSGFSLRPTSWIAFLGAAIMGVSLWPGVVQLMSYIGAPSQSGEQVDQLLEMMRRAGPMLAVGLGWAGLAEEFFFRGFLFTALSKATKPPATIVFTAVLFGLMHWLVGGGLGLGQLLPATLLGLILGTIRWHTGSALPGMVLHLIHNVVLNTLASYISQRPEWKESVPTVWLLFSLGVAPLGAILVFVGGRMATRE